MKSTGGGTGTIGANACYGDASWEDGIEPFLKGLDSWTRSGHGGPELVEMVEVRREVANADNTCPAQFSVLPRSPALPVLTNQVKFFDFSHGSYGPVCSYCVSTT